MNFKKLLFFLTSASLAAVVLGLPLAAPESTELDLERRGDLGEIDAAFDLERRDFGEIDPSLVLETRSPALGHAAKVRAATKVVQKQHANKAAKKTRKATHKAHNVANAANQKTAADARKTARKAAGVKRKDRTRLTPAQQTARKAAANPAKAARKQAHQTAVANKGATKAAKQARRKANHAAGVKGPARTAPKPRPARLSATDRKDVGTHLNNAGKRMQRMTNIPARSKQFNRPGEPSTSGRSVRQAVMNQNTRGNIGVGRYGAGNPTGFQNRRYRAGHAMAPGRPLPGRPTTGSAEYPVQSGAGWHGNAAPGAVRVITNHAGNRFHGVTTHDTTGRPPRGGTAGDHYEKTR